MNTKVTPPTCPQCGSAIPADAPQELCPRCVMVGAATATDSGRPHPRVEPPAFETLQAAFPNLEILKLIGRGGMGFVYKARQPKLDRAVALKLLPLELGADPHFAERFNREARALARLSHPNIVAVYDFGVSGGFGYLLMELVDGVNLREAMRAGRFSPKEALAVVPKICEALQFAHNQGVLHRDIKPENILLDGQGRVKIADFGIAKLVGDDQPDLSLTVSGAHLGTPAYMAPEQIEKPGEVDHRADIYSLGVVFYELLTGELPLGRFAPPSAKTELDARVDEIVMRALAKERELRQQSAGEVKLQCETVTANPREPGTGEGAGASAIQAGGDKGAHDVPSTLSTWRRVFGLRGLWVLLGVIALIAVPFLLQFRQRQLAEQQTLARAAVNQAATVPLLAFTFVAVEIRDDPAGPWLALDYSLGVQGDCQPTFRSQRIGMDLPVNTRMSSFQKEVAGGMVEHRRVEWQLPAALPVSDRMSLRDEVSKRWLHQTVSLRPGDEQRLFSTLTPEGTLLGFIGCKFNDPAPSGDRSGKTVNAATREVSPKAASTNSAAPSTPAASAPATNAAMTAAATANPVAALELEFARKRLAEVQKQAAVGLVAPQGPEVLDAELAVAVAEAELRGDPLAAARARVSHAESLLAITNAMHRAGKATQLELQGARLAAEKAKLALSSLDSAPAKPSPLPAPAKVF